MDGRNPAQASKKWLKLGFWFPVLQWIWKSHLMRPHQDLVHLESLQIALEMFRSVANHPHNLLTTASPLEDSSHLPVGGSGVNNFHTCCVGTNLRCSKLMCHDHDKWIDTLRCPAFLQRGQALAQVANNLLMPPVQSLGCNLISTLFKF